MINFFKEATTAFKTGRGRAFLKAKQPTLEIVGGMALSVAAVGEGIHATTKLEKILNNHEKKRILINERIPNKKSKKYKKEMAQLRKETTVDVAKNYALTAGLELGSLGLTGHGLHVINGRFAGACAAAAGAMAALDNYRANVIEDQGEEKDREYRYNVKKKKVSREETNEDGTTRTVEETEKIVSYPTEDTKIFTGSVYARIFDQKSGKWENQPDLIINLFKRVVRNANIRLAARGHLFLYEVTEALDLSPTKSSSIVGWYIPSGAEDTTGRDGCVMIGVMVNGEMRWDFLEAISKDRQLYDDFVREVYVNKRVLIDFNVDGVIHDLLEDDLACDFCRNR